MNISSDDRKKNNTVLLTLDDFFHVQKNVIFERARFNGRNQLPEETAEQFITALYGLADSCEYGTIKEEMIRDRIVVGIRDKALSEQMQLDPKLTLETAKTLTRLREAVHEQQQILRGSTKKVLVENIRQPSNGGARNHSQPRTGTQESLKCSHCGKAPHPRQSCQAKDAVCHKCQRKGHYSAQCFSKMAVKKVTQTDTVYGTSYLTAVTTNPAQTTWRVQVKIDGILVRFKLETGAEVAVISEETLNSMAGKNCRVQTRDCAARTTEVWR